MLYAMDEIGIQTLLPNDTLKLDQVSCCMHKTIQILYQDVLSPILVLQQQQLKQ